MGKIFVNKKRHKDENFTKHIKFTKCEFEKILLTKKNNKNQNFRVKSAYKKVHKTPPPYKSKHLTSTPQSKNLNHSKSSKNSHHTHPNLPNQNNPHPLHSIIGSL